MRIFFNACNFQVNFVHDLRFPFGDIPNQLLIYQVEVETHIGFWASKVRCTQYGFLEQATSKDARASSFLSRAGHAMIFGRVQNLYELFVEGCGLRAPPLNPTQTPPLKSS